MHVIHVFLGNAHRTGYSLEWAALRMTNAPRKLLHLCRQRDLSIVVHLWCVLPRTKNLHLLPVFGMPLNIFHAFLYDSVHSLCLTSTSLSELKDYSWEQGCQGVCLTHSPTMGESCLADVTDAKANSENRYKTEFQYSPKYISDPEECRQKSDNLLIKHSLNGRQSI